MNIIREIMTTEIAYATIDDNVFEVATMMKDHGIGMVPVLENGLLVGIITDRDLVIRGIAEKKPNSTSVMELMTTQLVTAHPDDSILDVVELMASAQVRRIPIVEGKKLVGIIALSDLATEEEFEDEAGFAISEISETELEHKKNDITH